MRERRWLLFLLALVLLVPAGCGGDDDEEGAGATTTETQAEAVMAGLVSDVGRFNDKSFNQSALEGLNRAKAELGAETRAIESRAAGDYVPNLSTLARQGSTSRSASASCSPKASTRSHGSSRTVTSRSSTTRSWLRRSPTRRRWSRRPTMSSD